MKRLILLLTALLTLSCAGAQEAKTTKEQKILEQAIKANTVGQFDEGIALYRK